MMPRNLLYTALLSTLGLLYLGACETVVDVEPPPHEPRLVAQSFFTQDSLWVVRVTRSVAYPGTERPAYVDDATVEIWQGDRLVVRPPLVRSGRYDATAPGAAADRRYTLHVAAPGLPSLEGTDALPAPPRIARFHETVEHRADSVWRFHHSRVELTIDDPPGEDNYYGLLVVEVGEVDDRTKGETEPYGPTLFTFESDDAALGEGMFDVFPSEKRRYRSAVFADGLFDGSTYTLDFDVRYNDAPAAAPYHTRRAFTIVLLSVSEDFYRHWKTAEEQADVNENPFAEPLRVHTNLDGGFGVFAGFSYARRPIALGHPELLKTDGCARIGTLPLCGVGTFPEAE